MGSAFFLRTVLSAIESDLIRSEVRMMGPTFDVEITRRSYRSRDKTVVTGTTNKLPVFYNRFSALVCRSLETPLETLWPAFANF